MSDTITLPEISLPTAKAKLDGKSLNSLVSNKSLNRSEERRVGKEC